MSEKPMGTRVAELEARVAKLEAIALHPPIMINPPLPSVVASRKVLSGQIKDSLLYSKTGFELEPCASVTNCVLEAPKDISPLVEVAAWARHYHATGIGQFTRNTIRAVEPR